MEWGIIMSVFTVIGMLVLIFAQPMTDHQTFGEVETSPPTKPANKGVQIATEELKEAA